ncbi:hypothetical protein [Emticicia fontis]
MEKSHKTTDRQSFFNQAVDIIDYMHNQRIFLIGKPMLSQFDYLICGYAEEKFGEFLKKKINNDKND